MLSEKTAMNSVAAAWITDAAAFRRDAADACLSEKTAMNSVTAA
jgi:hypothetical protein